MSIKEKLMHISPWSKILWSLILLLFLMFILSGVLMRLFGNFLSVIILLMVIVIFVFACEYHFDSIFKIHYQTETNPTEPNNSASAEEIKTLSFILLVIWNITS